MKSIKPSRIKVEAFTLVELAVVMVIIGLVISGIFIGRHLIKVAEFRALYSQIEQIETAAQSFKLKYNCLPGDCAKATQFFATGTQPAAVRNGNSDGMILALDAANLCASDYGFEWFSVFDHLSAAGLVSLPQYDETSNANNHAGFGYPLCKAISSGRISSTPGAGIVGFNDCGIRLGYEWTGHFIRLGVQPFYTWAPNVYNGYDAGYTPDEARLLDVKFDDGAPVSGKIQAASTSTYQCQPGPGDNTPTNIGGCANFATNTYLSTNTTRSCSLRIKTSL